MSKRKFKAIFRRVRKIRGARIVGKHGHLADLVIEFNVSMSFLSQLYNMNNTAKMLVYGKYTSEYQNEQGFIADNEAYYERLVGA